MSTISSNGNDPRLGWRDVLRFIVWLSVAYASIMAFKYLEFMMAFFATLMLIMLVGTIDDMTSHRDDD